MNSEIHGCMDRKIGWMYVCVHRWMNRRVYVKEKEQSQNYKFGIFGSFS